MKTCLHKNLYVIMCSRQNMGQLYSNSDLFVVLIVLPDRLFVGSGAGGGAFSSACSEAGLGVGAGLVGLLPVGALPVDGGAGPAVDGGNSFGFRPLLGRSAFSVSLSMAAGWQFSQC